MDVLSKDEFDINFDDIKMSIEEGALFIHPTDTIYGIGCDATNNRAVRKVRDIKDRNDSPFSVIAPSKEWIMRHCEVNGKCREWIDKLPGPYTLILKLKNKNNIAANVNSGLDTLGVRIPDHWIKDAVKKIGRPIITTSANKSGEDFMTSLENLNPKIEEYMDFIIYENEKHGRPSILVDLTGKKPVIRKR
jgi:L-threonylcarbamoyladenylate synthase